MEDPRDVVIITSDAGGTMTDVIVSGRGKK